MDIKDTIKNRIQNKQLLDEASAYATMKGIMDGTTTPSQIGAFLVALAVVEPSIEEVSGFVRCMKDHAKHIFPKVSSTLVDTCGTGGDALKTINISTLSALVAAGAGVPIAKHGNRGVTSACGSADVFEAFGVNIAADPTVVERCISTTGIGFMFAPVFHPAMKNVVIPRREIGLRTVFNVLGPLTNPANAQGQVLGVFEPGIMEMMADVLEKTGVHEYFIVHNNNGADELLPFGNNTIIKNINGVRQTLTIQASDFGLPESSIASIDRILEKDAIVNAFASILQDRGSEALKSAVIMNSALAIIAGGKTTDLKEAASMARTSLESSVALRKLEEMVRETAGNMDLLSEALN